MKAVQKEVDSTLEAVLQEQIPQKRGPLDKFSKVLHYALFPGGKRFRPALTVATAHACGGDKGAALSIGAAIELIHNYSLIHDDLPCMDNSGFRRGKQATHKEFDEGLALLAGNALLTDAFVVLSELPKRHSISVESTLEIINIIASCAGSSGMVAGQVLDLKSSPGISFPELEFLAIHKTGKLIYASVMAGALTGKPTQAERKALEKYGESMGLLFQILDDLDDTKTSIAQRTPEPPRASFVQILGVDESKQRASELIDDSIKAIKIFEKRGKPLVELVELLRSKLSSTTQD